MKKIVFFIIVITISLVSNAQVDVDTAAMMTIDGTNSGIKALTGKGIQTNKVQTTNLIANNVHAENVQTDEILADYVYGLASGTISGTSNYVINGVSYMKGTQSSHTLAAVRGYNSLATSQTGKYYGVRGTCKGTNSSEGHNYGVFGSLNLTSTSGGHGAGVYGTYKSNPSSVLPIAYAGYFDGPVGINGNLVVSGTINGVVLGRSTAPSSTSPSAQVEDISSTSSVSDKFLGLNAQSFYNDMPANAVLMDDVPTRNQSAQEEDTQEDDDITALTSLEMQVYSKRHYALNAEQLEEVFPDLVYENEDGTKSINYVEMVPILVQAVNELSAKVAALESNNETAKKVKGQTTNIDDTGENVTLLALGQNKPNPFGTATTIEVSVPETVQNAFVYVYDLQGKKVQQVDITARGKQSIQFTSANLSDGMYLYSLIADGKVVETRRMIFEK